MYKSKDGKVMASLTEVKNKTGDIFALVDEFGEVVLTSYNRARYRIVKIGVSDILESTIKEDKKPVVEKVEEKPKSVIAKVVSKVPNIINRSAPVAKEEVKPVAEMPEVKTSLLSADVLAKLVKFQSWDRNNKKEKAFIAKALNPLQ